jgi:hypothetical protein
MVYPRARLEIWLSITILLLASIKPLFGLLNCQQLNLISNEMIFQ